jgi:flagellar M-ring protein FliF
MGKARIGLMMAAGVAVFIFFSVTALHLTTGGMSPLYTGLSLEDSSKIVAELEKNSISYELVGSGSEILVPSDRVLRLRMDMAGQGLPSGGNIVGYEIFDRSETFGSSNFVLNINMMRALEGELSRTIGSLADIDSARVHLVMPKRELFTRETEKPSASVTVKMRGGRALEGGEVTAITHLVASAVPQLEASRVTIVDNHGRLLARGDGADSADAAAGNNAQYRANYENHMRQQLEEMVEKVIGEGKVRVQIAADINFDRTVTNSEKYDPDGQVARSTQSNSETDASTDKSGKETTSVATNVPPPGGAGGESNSSNHKTDRSTETTNYEISKVVQNHISEGGVVNKMSVAVLVDGTYSKDADGKDVYAPRTEDEMKQLKNLISSAMGYDEKRGDKLEIVNMRFTQEALEVGNDSFFQRFKFEMQSIIQTLIIAVVAVLVILLVLRPAVNQLIKQSQTPSERVSGELAALEGGGGGGGGGGGMARLPGIPSPPSEAETLIDVANVKGGMKSSTVKKVAEIVDKYPEETMGVIRNWIVKQS